LWHETAGLVVSLNNCPLPNFSTESRHEPAFFNDSEIWRAFYAKNGAFIAPIFDRLDYTGPQILEKVIQVDQNTFSLPDSIIGEWSRLENALLDVADHSLATHPKAALIPPITWPRNPHECGYRRTHRSPAIVLRSAMRSQEAFHSLSAVVTFILSLWTDSESLCSAPFHSAFWGLANRNYSPVHRSWIDRFSRTHVCKITLGIRPGCLINPYTSRWGPWLDHFVRAGVQVWVVWGGPDVIHNRPSFSNKAYDVFLPPDEVILEAKSRFRETQALQLPSPLVPADFPTQDSTPFNPSTQQHPSPPSSSAEPPLPPPSSRQRRGETLAEFLVRLKEGKLRREASETSSECQSRREREIAAAQKGYSKSCTVFQWKQTQGHYLRVKVDRVEVPDVWYDYPASRRVYHGHLNEWDLCPPIPPFFEHLTQQDVVEIQQFDDELEFANALTTLKAPSDQFADQHSGLMDELASRVPSSQPISLQFDVVEHLRDRYGFDAHRHPSWTPNLHDKPVADVVAAKGRFLFQSTSSPQFLEEAITNFCNVLANADVRVHNLPRAWDLSNLQLQIPGLRLSLGTHVVNNAPLFTISSTSSVQGDWVICLLDPTTVLQIYRNQWTTLDKIVRELIIRGIPFNTGVSGFSPNMEVVDQSRGLGSRPLGYQPSSNDYNAYVSERTDVLRGHLGRAALLKGGLVARLARDTVGVSDVLSGPEPSSSVMIGTVDGVKLFDDRLSNYLLDVISGVYYVETATNPQIHQHLSWWPKEGVWNSSGYFSEQWSADAESWYQARLKTIENGSGKLYNSTKWKSELRRYKTTTRALLTENHRLSRSVVDKHMSYASFYVLLHGAN
jgi:hypothetical protein